MAACGHHVQGRGYPVGRERDAVQHRRGGSSSGAVRRCGTCALTTLWRRLEAHEKTVEELARAVAAKAKNPARAAIAALEKAVEEAKADARHMVQEAWRRGLARKSTRLKLQLPTGARNHGAHDRLPTWRPSTSAWTRIAARWTTR